MNSKFGAERRCDIATAKLGVAEELRWVIACPFAFLLYLKFDLWIPAAVVGVIIFFLVTHWYEREYDAANADYERLTGTGKYCKPSESNDGAE